MSEFRDTPAATFLRSIEIDRAASVPLARVVEQRAAVAELCASALLQPSLDVLLAEACRVASAGCDAPLAKVLEHHPSEGQFVVRAGVGWQPGVVGRARAADDPSNPAGESLATRRPVTVRDVRQRRDYHLPPIYPQHGIVSTANVPILGISGFYGVLEVDRSEERPFDSLDSTFLASVAGIVADAVERVRRQDALQKTHDARAVLLREHHHRARNNYQAIIARLQRHARAATTEDSRRRFEDVERRVFGLAALYDHLIGDAGEDRLDLARYMADLCDRMREFYAVAERGIELSCGCRGGSIALDTDSCTAFGIAINELVANAVEHAFGPQGGRIDVRLQQAAGGVEAVVADNGGGFGAPGPESIGLSVVEQLVATAGGSLSRAVPEGGGTVWTILLPRRAAGG